MRKKEMRQKLLCALLVACVALATLAQTAGYREGDRVQTPDGRTAVVETFKMPDMAKVKFDDGTTRFYMRSDLKKVEPPKPVPTEPQETLRVGDSVIDTSKPDTIRREGKIESISGGTATVRYGTYRYDYFKAELKDLMSAQAWNHKQDEEKEQKLLRAAFEDEARPFHHIVYIFAWAYKPQFKMNGGRIPQDAAEIAELRKSLEGLAAVCRKYPNLTNAPGVDDPINAGDINMHPADWCGVAAQRDALMKKVLGTAGNIRARDNIGIWENAIREAVRDPNGYVKDGVQQLVYDRAAWQQKELRGVQESYAKAGEQIPAEILAPLFKQADELKAKIEQDALARSWQQPAYKDAALEGLVRAAFPKQYPGVQVLKTGMTYATWKAYDDTSLVSIHTGYKLYRVDRDKYRQKDGLALVRLPGQTLCQIREFTLEQVRNGAAFGAARVAGIARGGVFVKCR